MDIYKNYLRINRSFVEMTLKDCMHLMDRYNLIYVRKNGNVSIKKRIKAKYWHILYRYYLELNEFVVRSALVGEYFEEDEDFGRNICILVRVIPLLIDIEVVKNSKRLNWLECFLLDKK